jgi:hypothetical protein
MGNNRWFELLPYGGVSGQCTLLSSLDDHRCITSRSLIASCVLCSSRLVRLAISSSIACCLQATLSWYDHIRPSIGACWHRSMNTLHSSIAQRIKWLHVTSHCNNFLLLMTALHRLSGTLSACPKSNLTNSFLTWTMIDNIQTTLSLSHSLSLCYYLDATYLLIGVIVLNNH